MRPETEAVLDRVELVPLKTDPDGVIRVTGTRVTLDTIAEAFDQGATAEEIAQQYPSVDLADIYSTLGYVLRHREEVSNYLSRRASQRSAIRSENENKFSPSGIRDRLKSRQVPQAK